MNNASYHHRWRWRGWPLRATAFTVLLALWAVASCSRDSETPVGSELTGDILGSAPGSTFVDTLFVQGDTVVPTYTVFGRDPELALGIEDEYEHVIILRPDTSMTGDAAGRTVESARFRITMDTTAAVYPDIRARFLLLTEPYKEGDRLVTLDTAGVLTDPGNGGAEVRTITIAPFGGNYQIPDTVARDWLSGAQPNNGIAILYTGTADQMALFESRQTNGQGGDATNKNPPQFVVNFTDNSSKTYNMFADGTYVRALTTTNNSIISNAFVRRLYWQVDLDQLDTTLAVNKATVRFYVVDGTVLSSPQSFNYYVPGSTDTDSDAFLSGYAPLEPFTPLSPPPVLNESGGWLELPLTAPVIGMLRGTTARNGFVIRYLEETQKVRQAEFYTSSAPNDTLRPRVIFTLSAPAEFDR